MNILIKLLTISLFFFTSLLYAKTAPTIYALGDIHGDLQATLSILKKANLIDAKTNQWIGGKAILVQTGDQVDRGDEDKGVLDFFDGLALQAKGVGGRVYSLLANHEWLNTRGYLNYTTLKSNTAFLNPSCPNNPLECRKIIFSPTNTYAKILSNRNAILILDKYIFVHGGIRLSPDLSLEKISSMNKELSNYLLTGTKKPSWPDIEEGPLLDRSYSAGEPTPAICKELSSVLSKLEAKVMLVGHTIQNQGINSACNGMVWRIDVGMSIGFYPTNPAGQPKPQILKIQSDGTFLVIK